VLGCAALMAGSPFARIARAVLPVQRGELTSALLLILNLFVLLTINYVLKVVREPLILLGGGAELKAYASAGIALLSLIVIPAFGVVASRVNRAKLLTAVQATAAACLVAFYLLARLEAPIGLAFYLWLGIYNMLVVSNFWSFANDLYDQEQGKRLFPIVALGGSVGAILGAYFPKWLEGALGAYELMVVSAIAIVGTILLYRAVDRRERLDRDPRGTVAVTKPEAVRPVEREGGFTLVIKDRYLRLIAVLVLLATLVNTSGEYVASKMATDAGKARAAEVIAAEQAAAPAPMAPEQVKKRTKAVMGAYLGDFFSSYYGLVNLVAFLIQALLVAYILGKLGVRGAVLVMPIVVLFGWVGFVMVGSLMAIRAEKTVENSLDYSLQNTVKQALYLPTSRASKYKAKAAIDTFFVRLADAIIGIGVVVLFVDVLDLGVRAFAIMNIALAALWIVVAVLTGRVHDQRAAERASRAAQGLRETAV
jgi:ATP:ADP antiporter, AAA family